MDISKHNLIVHSDLSKKTHLIINMVELIFSIALSALLLYALIQIIKRVDQENKEKKQENASAPTTEKKESFCTCQGLGRETCNNPQVMQALYNTNTLTEYTDLRKFQDTSKWKNASPYDQFYVYDKKYNSCGQLMQ